MTDLPITVCCWDYDRTKALIDGRVPISGVKPSFTVLNPVEIFARAFSTAEFDVTELSLSGQISAVAKGNAVYQAIPVHLSRAFRHSIIYVRNDRGIASPADLKGKTIGTTDYDMTAAVVLRGQLRDEYALAPSDMAWRIGGLDKPEDTAHRIRSTPGVDIQPLKDRTIDGEFARGSFDAVITVHPPPCFVAGNPNVERLFPDWRQAEQDYAARTGIFPIMHVVGVRKTLLEKQPWLSRALYEAFERAKQMAIAELAITQAPRVTLPWVVAELAATRRALGDDFWPYGLKKNRRTLEALLRYSFDEGLTPRLLAVEELFSVDTIDL